MSLKDYRSVIDSIYGSGYFTNHGPLAQKLEESLQRIFEIENAVVIGNETLAVIIALAGLKTSGCVVVSAGCPDFLVNAVAWAGLEPVVFGSDGVPGEIAAFLVYDGGGEGTAKTSLVNLAKSKHRKAVLYQPGLQFLRGGTRPFPRDDHVVVAPLGDVGREPSSRCAAILTGSSDLAENCRNIRSSYGARKTVEVTATANGRVSEFQAGMALVFLERGFTE